METKADIGSLPETSPLKNVLTVQLTTIVITRLILNTCHRMIYAFALAFSRGLGIPITGITSLIALRQGAALFGVVFGFVGDRWGYKLVMTPAVALLAAGLLIGGLMPSYVTFVLVFIFASLSKALFDPMAQAYVGEQIPYQRRGMAIGVLELAWAGSTLIGIPLVGLLIDRAGWRSPLLVLGILAAISLVAVIRLIPGDSHRRRNQANPSSLKRIWQQVRHNRLILVALGFTFFITVANEILFVMYGVWMESHFGLTVVAVGASAMVIGTAELLGEGLTAFVSDRIGLNRSLLIGITFSMLSYLLLSIAHTLPLALIAIFVIFLGFEFTIVTSFAYLTELLMDARGAMMSMNMVAANIGRMVGALIGAALWLAGGMSMISISATLVSGCALFCLVILVRRRS